MYETHFVFPHVFFLFFVFVFWRTPSYRKEVSDADGGGGGLTDTCLLYSSYRHYGKVIDRSDWFTDFRESVTFSARGKNSAASSSRAASSGGIRTSPRGKEPPQSANPSKSGKQKKGAEGGQDIGGGGRGGGGSGGGNDAGSEEEEEVIDPNGPEELRARFKHASDELAFLGYVQPYKRRRREDIGGRGPRGAVTRLVYAYTMQGGNL